MNSYSKQLDQLRSKFSTWKDSEAYPRANQVEVGLSVYQKLQELPDEKAMIVDKLRSQLTWLIHRSDELEEACESFLAGGSREEENYREFLRNLDKDIFEEEREMVLTGSTMLGLGTRAVDFELGDVVTGERVSLGSFFIRLFIVDDRMPS